jgi:hypothetical protein
MCNSDVLKKNLLSKKALLYKSWIGTFLLYSVLVKSRDGMDGDYSSYFRTACASGN